VLIWAYDKTFEGFLSLVFECFERKTFPEKIMGQEEPSSLLFNPELIITTNEAKAQRVWSGLHKRISEESCQMLYYAFLSELPDMEMCLLLYARKVFTTAYNIEANFGDDSVLTLLKIRKKVLREAERIRMFVRFQRTADDLYYASFDPKYNVLPLSIGHFEKRFADQRWIIYDTHRNYGFYYDLHKTSEIRFTESLIDPLNGNIDQSALAEDEKIFQQLWKNYFNVICIKERINPRLHVQLLPKRFWKYLPEKQ
jgi:probable DNA metabolism protein